MIVQERGLMRVFRVVEDEVDRSWSWWLAGPAES